VCGLTSAEYRGMPTSLLLLATLFLIEARKKAPVDLLIIVFLVV